MNELQKAVKEFIQYYNTEDGVGTALVDWKSLDNMVRNLGITLAVDLMNEGEENENA